MDLRQQSESRLETLSLAANLPSSKHNDYRVTFKAVQNLDLSKRPSISKKANSARLFAEEGELALTVLSADSDTFSPIGYDKLPEGVEIHDLNKVLASGKGPVSAALKRSFKYQSSDFESDVFNHLVEARWQTGIFVWIKKNVKVKNVLRTLHLFSDDSGLFLEKVVVLAESGSEVSYCDEWIGSGHVNGTAPLLTSKVQIIAEPNANVNYYQLQNLGPAVQGFIRQSFFADQDASVSVTSYQRGGSVVQTRSEAECVGTGAFVDLHGASKVEGDQVSDFWMNARHKSSDTTSKMDFKSVLDGNSRGAFNANIIIEPTAFRTDAVQTNKNLLLSNQASIHTVPKLEIATDDVKCAHGTSTAPVDESQITYLRARGISPDDAEKMIVDGFLNSVISRFPTEGLRSRAVAPAQSDQSLGFE